MPKSKSRHKPAKRFDPAYLASTDLPAPLAQAAERLGAIGISARFRKAPSGEFSTRIEGYRPLDEEDARDLLRNAALMSEEDWSDFLRPRTAWLFPLPGEQGRYALMPIGTIAGDEAPLTYRTVSLERPEDVLDALRTALGGPEGEIADEEADLDGDGAYVDLMSLTLSFPDDRDQADPVLAALRRACAPAHPLTNPDDLRLGRALARDIGHDRFLLINGDILTSGSPRRVLSRFDYEDLIDELAQDYDLTDPSATEGILGRDAAEDLAMEVISEMEAADLEAQVEALEADAEEMLAEIEEHEKMESEDAPVADAARVRRTLH